MLIIRLVLIVSALLVVVYPVWGLIYPTSYLPELVEVYPHAEGASVDQVKKAALILWLSNIILSLSLFLLALFIKKPQNYKLAKLSAIALIGYPIMLTIVEVLSSSVLYSHLDKAPVVVEFSAIKGFYIIFGLALIGVYKSQRELNKPIQ